MSLTKAGLLVIAAAALAAGTGGVALALVGAPPVQQAPPWIGSLQDDAGDHHCGAALLGPQWAVTAAHCTTDRTADRLRLGSLDYRNGGDVVGIMNAVTAPNGADLALLHLSSPAPGNPITIAPASPSPDTPVTLLGWGQTRPEPGASPPSPVLRQLQTQVLDGQACGGTGEGFTPGDELCIAGTPERTACYGDSGGPAVVDGQLVGVTSRGSETCGDQDTVYTDVTAARAWIAKVTGTSTGGPQSAPAPAPAPAAAGPQATPSADPPADPPAAAADGARGPRPARTGTVPATVRGTWRIRLVPGGPATGLARDGQTVRVECRVPGPTLIRPGVGTSASWDRLPGQGYLPALAVDLGQGQGRDQDLPRCSG